MDTAVNVLIYAVCMQAYKGLEVEVSQKLCNPKFKM